MKRPSVHQDAFVLVVNAEAVVALHRVHVHLHAMDRASGLRPQNLGSNERKRVVYSITFRHFKNRM